MSGVDRRGLLAFGAAAPLALAVARVLAQPTTQLEITVLEGETPRADITVKVESFALPQGEIAVASDTAGVVLLVLESAGLFDVRVETPGFETAILRDVRVTGGETTSVTLNLVPRTPGSGSY